MNDLVKNKKILVDCLFYIACTLCLLWPALYSGYPLVTPDSGGYIGNSIELHVPIERPIAYSVFIRITSLFGLSLWGVVFTQTLLLVLLLKRVCKKILVDKYSKRLFFIIILLLSAFTSCSWETSHLMPDIFTAMLLLLIADFYLSSSNTKKPKIIYFVSIWFLMEQHNSNLLIGLIICLFARLYYLVSRNKWFVKKTAFLFYITIFSFISISFFNLWEGNSFRPSASSHVFMMSRMAENGILDDFLKEYCPTEHYSICNYQGETGNRQWDFMWNDKGHLHDEGGYPGGWVKTEKEYNQIILRTFIRPKYLVMQIYESMEATLRQMTQITVQIMVQREGSAPYSAVEKYFPRELKEYKTSIQQRGELGTIMSFFNAALFLFAIVLAVSCLWMYERYNTAPSPNLNFLMIMLITGVIINAWATGTFSTIVERLQTRVFWLIPFACILFLMITYLNNKKVESANR